MGVSGKCDYTFNFAEFYRFILWLLNKQYSFVFFDRILCQMNHSLIVLSLIHGLQNIPCVHQSKIHCGSNLQTKSACLSMVYLWLMLGMRGSGTGQDEIFFIHISYTNLYLVFLYVYGIHYMVAHHIVVQHKLNEHCAQRFVSNKHFSKLLLFCTY